MAVSSSNGYCRPDVLRRIGLACSVINSLHRGYGTAVLSVSAPKYTGTLWSRRANGRTEISVDDVYRWHQWLTNQIAEAPLHWRHEPTSIHQVSVADTSSGKPPVYSCRLPRVSMLQQNRPYQCLVQHMMLCV